MVRRDPAPRLGRLPLAAVLNYEVPVAIGARARLLGLAHLDRETAGPGLLIPRCSSVHTFCMRFALDLVFLDGGGAIVSVHRRIPARRVVFHRGARSVLEIPSGQGGEFSPSRP
ncbi:MAG: DUF192 domain-containing protein [Solirubrobacterales bacterium]